MTAPRDPRDFGDEVLAQQLRRRIKALTGNDQRTLDLLHELKCRLWLRAHSREVDYGMLSRINGELRRLEADVRDEHERVKELARLAGLVDLVESKPRLRLVDTGAKEGP